MEGKIKIIFINNLSHGGAERVVSRLFTNGFFISQVNLWLLDKSCDYSLSSRVVKRVFKYPVWAFIAMFSLGTKDILQAHLNKPILISTLAKLFGCKFQLHSVHCFAYSGFYLNSTFLKRIHRIIFGVLLKRVDHHIFKSHEMVSDFKKVFGWSPLSYEVIYNPYNVSDIVEQSMEQIELVKTNKNNLDVTVVGRIASSKRISDIVELAKLNKERFDFHIVGDGPLLNVLKEKVKSEEIKNLTFYGRVNNPYPYMRQANVYLSCSESEGFPNTLIESLICNLVCIHSDCVTGPKEILSGDPAYQLLNDFEVVNSGVLFKTGSLQSANKALDYVYVNWDTLSNNYFDKGILDKVGIDNITNLYSDSFLIFGGK